MKRWWTVIKIGQHKAEPVIIVKKGKMSKSGITKAIKRAVNRDNRTSTTVLACGYRYVFQERRPKY